MPLIDYVDMDDDEKAHYEKRSLYKEVEMNNPVVTAIHDQLLYDLLDAGPADKELFEYIMVAVAQANECSYCASSHRENLHKDLGMDREAVQAMKAGDFSVLPADVQPVVEFASKVAEDPHRIVEADLESLYAVGYDESDVVQLLSLITYCDTCNTIVDALGVEPADRDDELPLF